MSIEQLIPIVESLSRSEKFQLIQFLLSNLAQNERDLSHDKPEVATSQGERMASILQRMAERQALSSITDPVAWQREIREDRSVLGRE